MAELRPAELFVGEAQGACRGVNWMTFFPLRGEPTEPAKAICAGCPVREPCLEWAIPNEKVGIWGGSSERTRRSLRRLRKLPEPDGSVVLRLVQPAAP